MQASDTPLPRAALRCAIGSAGAIAASIAVSQVLPGASLALVIIHIAARQAGVTMLIGVLVIGLFEHCLGDREIPALTLPAAAYIDSACREATHV
jgi:hypothetical protein